MLPSEYSLHDDFQFWYSVGMTWSPYFDDFRYFIVPSCPIRVE